MAATLSGSDGRQNDEAGLVADAAAGDREAFAELVRRHHPRLIGLCRSLLGDAEMAEDAAQEVFLKAWKGLSGFRGGSQFYTWLHRIGVRHCLDMLRAEGRRKSRSWDSLLEEEGERAQALLAQPDSAATLEASDLVAKLLSGLSPEYRMVLTLRELDGLSYEEIADAMECSLDSVKARLRRARQDVLERMRRLMGRP